MQSNSNNCSWTPDLQDAGIGKYLSLWIHIYSRIDNCIFPSRMSTTSCVSGELAIYYGIHAVWRKPRGMSL